MVVEGLRAEQSQGTALEIETSNFQIIPCSQVGGKYPPILQCVLQVLLEDEEGLFP